MSAIRKPRAVTVEHFYREHAERLQLKLVTGEQGMDRTIREGAVNRMGMALTGFTKYFANQRVQLIGKSETAYLSSLPPEDRGKRFRAVLERNIPCIVFSRNLKPPTFVIQEAKA